MGKKRILLFNRKSGKLYRNHFGFLSAIPYPFPSSSSIRQWPFIKSYMLSYMSLGIAFFFEKHEFTLNSMRFFFCIGRQNTILKFLVSFWLYRLLLFTYQRSFVRDWGQLQFFWIRKKYIFLHMYFCALVYLFSWEKSLKGNSVSKSTCILRGFWHMLPKCTFTTWSVIIDQLQTTQT